MKKYSLQIFVAILVLANFVSCHEAPVDDNVYVDSYIHSILDASNVPVYAVMHTTYSYRPLTSVIVNGIPLDLVVKPEMVPGASSEAFSFNSVLSPASYLSTVPSPASYEYDLTYGTGKVAKSSDGTVQESLEPASGLEVQKYPNYMEVKWNPVVNAQAYKVRIFYQKDIGTPEIPAYENVLILDSDFIDNNPQRSQYSFTVPQNGFKDYVNTRIIFQVSAFIFQKNRDTYHAVSDAETVPEYY